VISGLSNQYSHYITTFDEYQEQRYEGASTLYGPHTAAAFTQEFSTLLRALLANKPVDAGKAPPDLRGKQIGFAPPVIVDAPPPGFAFGDVVVKASPEYACGATVSVTFVGASPRNDLRLDGTFLTVEKQDANGAWNVVANDASWETKYRWKRVGIASSHVTVDFDTGTSIVTAGETPRGSGSGSVSGGGGEGVCAHGPGLYRIRTFGTHRTLLQKLEPYEGTSSTFTLVRE
jgi:neutral ceramidase